MSKFTIINLGEKQEEYIDDNFYGYSVQTHDFHFIYSEYCFSEKDEITKNRIANCIFMFLQERPLDGYYYWKFVYDNKTATVNLGNHFINTYGLMVSYPKDINDRIDQILLNLHKDIKSFGDTIDINYITDKPRTFLPEGNDMYKCANIMFDSLMEMNLINQATFTIEGWKRIDQLLKKKNVNSKTIFIASKFDNNKDTISAIAEAITKEGFEPITLYTHQTNDYIMPEMFKLIDKSVAVVADITSENSNVMFEVGYAKGKGINTILISKSDIDEKGLPINPIHSFDISQISIIYYRDLNDLKNKLAFRIKNTID